MAERTRAFAVRVGEAFVERLKDHVAENSEQWAEVPQNVEFGIRSNWGEGPFPLIGVTIPAFEDQNVGSNLDGTGGRGELSIAVMGFTHDPAAPEQAAHELAADIRRAINAAVAGRQLGQVLASGVLFYNGYEVQVDPESGHGACVVSFRANLQWDGTAP